LCVDSKIGVDLMGRHKNDAIPGHAAGLLIAAVLALAILILELKYSQAGYASGLYLLVVLVVVMSGSQRWIYLTGFSCSVVVAITHLVVAEAWIFDHTAMTRLLAIAAILMTTLMGHEWLAERDKRHGGRRYLRSLLDTILDGVVACNEKGIIEYVNPRIERMFGYGRHQLIGRNVSLLMPAEVRCHHDQYMANYLRTGRGSVVGKRSHLRAQRHSGDSFPAEIAVTDHRTPQGHLFVAVIRDLSDMAAVETKLEGERARIKQLQDILVHQESLATLGAMAADVVRDVSGPVESAVGGIQRACTDLAQLPADKAAPAPVVGALARTIEGELTDLQIANDLIQSFKRVSADQVGAERRQIMVEKCLQDILRSMKPRMGQTSHQIHLSCDEGLVVTTFPGVMAQIINHLVMNSLEHGFQDIEDGHINIRVHQVGGQLELIYRDNGCGISEEDLEQVASAFFTTRKGLASSGLGMHLIHQLVTVLLGGDLEINSVPGQGVEIRLWFPVDIPHTSPLESAESMA
jgi:PAS domain S-box-containing protein